MFGCALICRTAPDIERSQVALQMAPGEEKGVRVIRCPIEFQPASAPCIRINPAARVEIVLIIAVVGGYAVIKIVGCTCSRKCPFA